MKKRKSHQRLNIRELASETRKFDREFVVDESRPLSAEDKKQ